MTVLEARDRIGGRIWTVDAPGGPIELGAQWIHGSSNPIMCAAAAHRQPPPHALRGLRLGPRLLR